MPCCALLYSRSNDIHTFSYTVRLLYKTVEDTHAGSRQLCMLAGVVVWHIRKRKHCKARYSTSRHGMAQLGPSRHSTAPHGTVRHRTAPHAWHDTAWHRTALRRAVELSKLNGAGVFFCAFSYTQLGVTRKKNLSPHILKAIKCAQVLP